MLNIQTLKKRIEGLETKKSQPYVYIPIEERIKNMTDEEIEEAFKEYNTPEIRKFLDQICPEDKNTWPVQGVTYHL